MRMLHHVALWGTGLCMVACGIFSSVHAQSKQPAHMEPLVCSAFETRNSAPSDKCEVTHFTRPDDPAGKKRTQVKIRLEAQSKEITVGGYRVITENYGSYIPPIVEAAPGDTVAAHLKNNLGKPFLPSPHAGHHSSHPHGDHQSSQENPTNLHYFHGGIVTPNNSRPMDARLGNGDNVYVYLKRNATFDFSVPIPGERELDPQVLEGEGLDWIAHPTGLNWYHSHLHGISSTQVMGGLSGLLSVGDPLANVKAACQEDPADKTTCTNSVKEDTQYLKDHTDPKYLVLRDLPLRNATVSPLDADGTATATWAPDERDSPRTDPCGIRGSNGNIDTSEPRRHEGYCQRVDKKDPTNPDKDSTNRVWLFTINGQRFPAIPIGKERNAIFRMGNLSANMAYWLALECEEGCEQIPPTYRLPKTAEQPAKTYLKLEILSLDGVVPAKIVRPDETGKPKANTFLVGDFLLMPASRVELYVRNDFRHDRRISLILHTKQLRTGSAPKTDTWPEIQLARIVLEPSTVESQVVLALNAPVAPVLLQFAEARRFVEAPTPPGCVRDLEPETDLSKREHRRVTFGKVAEQWRIATEIVRFPDDLVPADARKCKAADGSERACVDGSAFVPDKKETIGIYDGDILLGVPFEAYDNGDGLIDWFGKKTWSESGQELKLKHTCIYMDGSGRSLKQLWALVNATGELHNFHIHQMKFRLAKLSELNQYRIIPDDGPSTCPGNNCSTPNYKLYEDKEDPDDLEVRWHDTIPLPAGKTVYIVMSFAAEQQLGRYVYHCHILKHEDNGLMAPMEVLDPNSVPVDR